MKDEERARAILDAGLESAFKARDASRGYVIEAIASALACVREECAKVADAKQSELNASAYDGEGVSVGHLKLDQAQTACEIAFAIRALGK